MRTAGGARVPPVLRPFTDEPDTAVTRLAELVRAYWQRVLAPHWDRLRVILEGDVLYRARQLTEGGAQKLFSDLHPEARFADNELLIEKRWEETLELDGRGLLFVPSAFVWPHLAALSEPPWQPTLIYPARGVAMLWEPGQPAPDALAALLGRRRASVLAALEVPRSTTELARALELAPASVSQHLAVLSDAGLVNGHRVGRAVLYARSPAGDLLAAGGGVSE
jgi:DNA-binding transcriptional ArsR family regulator